MTDSQSFQSARLQIYGTMKDVRFLSKTYLWGQELYQPLCLLYQDDIQVSDFRYLRTLAC